MQPNQQGRRFSETSSQQPVYRFPQNQNANGWQPQQTFPACPQQDESTPLSGDRKREKKHRHKRRKIFTLWNLFAVIGLVTTIIQVSRYVIIPALVYLKVLAGGAL